jgi:hypothetical protein
MSWTDSDGGDIRRGNLDGSGQQTLVTGLNFPVGIALQFGAGPIPEPATRLLLVIGTLGLIGKAWRHKQREQTA